MTGAVQPKPGYNLFQGDAVRAISVQQFLKNCPQARQLSWSPYLLVSESLYPSNRLLTFAVENTRNTGYRLLVDKIAPQWETAVRIRKFGAFSGGPADCGSRRLLFLVSRYYMLDEDNETRGHSEPAPMLRIDS